MMWNVIYHFWDAKRDRRLCWMPFDISSLMSSGNVSWSCDQLSFENVPWETTICLNNLMQKHGGTRKTRLKGYELGLCIEEHG